MITIMQITIIYHPNHIHFCQKHGLSVNKEEKENKNSEIQISL